MNSFKIFLLAIVEQVKHRYINRFYLFISELECKKINELCSHYLGQDWELSQSFPAIWERTRKQKKFSRCLGKGIQGVSIGKYIGTGIPANICGTLGMRS